MNGKWSILLPQDALKDLLELEPPKQAKIMVAIEKQSRNPLPQRDGGYGVELSGDLAGCLKIKLKRDGLRVVYRLLRDTHIMQIVAIGSRTDEEVYRAAARRLKH